LSGLPCPPPEKGTYFNIMKAMFDESTAKILNSEKLKAFPLKSLILK